MTAQLENACPPVRSEFADDADFAELLEMFVESVQEKRIEFQSALAEEDYDQLRVLSHQLKGSGAGYGFSTVSEKSAAVEDAYKKNDTEAGKELLEDLIDYLGRVTL